MASSFTGSGPGNPVKTSELIVDDVGIAKVTHEIREFYKVFGEGGQSISEYAEEVRRGREEVARSTADREKARRAMLKEREQVDALVKARQRLADIDSEAQRELVAINQTIQEQTNWRKNEIRLANSAAGSYNALSAQYSLNKIELNGMSEAMRQGTEYGRNLEKETRDIYAQMDRLQKATGKYSLSVGNYESHWNALDGSIARVTRSLPGAGEGIQGVAQAISTNIPSLIRGIARVRDENRKLEAQGKSTTSAIMRIARSIISWNTAIVLGVSLVARYGEEIITWIKGLINGNKQLTELQRTQTAINSVMQTGTKEANRARIELQLLYEATQDESLAMDQRREATRKLQEMYPSYLGNLTEEEILTGKAATQYYELSDALLETARRKAAFDKIVENTSLATDLMFDEGYNEMQRQVQELRAIAENLESGEFEVDGLSDVVLRGLSGIAGAPMTWVDVYNQRAEQAMRKWQKENPERAKQIKDAGFDILNAINEIDNRNESLLNLGAGLSLITNPNNDRKEERERQQRERAAQAAARRAEQTNSKRLREQERQAKLLFDFTRRQERAETEAIEDEQQRRIALINFEADWKIKEAERAYSQIEDKTKLDEQALTQTIEDINAERNRNVLQARQNYELSYLQLVEEGIRLRLQAVRKGSEDEQALQLALIKAQRETALTRNSYLPAGQRQDTDVINVGFDTQVESRTASSMQSAINIAHQISLAEIAVMENSEAAKTRLRVAAEIERYKRLLQLQLQYGTIYSDQDVAITKLTIQRLQNELETAKQPQDIFDLLGINITDEKRQGIQQMVEFITGQLEQLFDAQVELAQKAVEAAQQRVAAAQSLVDAERQAKANGYAYDLADAQRRLALEKKTEEDALKQQQKAQKARDSINAASQISNLVTASALIWSQLGFPWALGAIGAMWGSFAAAKIKAAQLTKAQTAQEYGEGGYEFFNYGGSHASGNDIDLGTMPDGRKRRAERGEFMGVLSKRMTSKYRGLLPGLWESLRGGTFEQRFMGATSPGNMRVNVVNDRGMIRDIRAIRRASQTSTFIDGAGRTVIRSGNLTRRIKR